MKKQDTHSVNNYEPEVKQSFRQILKSLCHPRIATMFFLGFSSGLPLLLIFSSLSLWLRDANIERATVTYFSWAALGYSFKFIWAPIVDQLPLPILDKIFGRRRAWLLMSQVSIILSLIFMALNDPVNSLTYTAVGAILLGFSGATQDIVIDAYRIEANETKYQSLVSSAYITGYRIGMLLAGAGALLLADLFGGGLEGYQYNAWSAAYLCMALAMGIGIITTLSISEPKTSQNRSLYSNSEYLRYFLVFIVAILGFIFTYNYIKPIALLGLNKNDLSPIVLALFSLVRLITSATIAILLTTTLIKLEVAPKILFYKTYVEPFADFFKRYHKVAFLLLVFICVYRISDIVMGAITNIFYDDMGYTKKQIALVSKSFGLFMTIGGSFLGGILVLRYGLLKVLWLGAFLCAVTNILFAILAFHPPQVYVLASIIAADNLSGGLAGVVFIAFLSSLTSEQFTAVQYAVFSSLMTLFPKIIAGYSGSIVDHVGYEAFFIGAGLLGLPVILLVTLIGKKLNLK